MITFNRNLAAQLEKRVNDDVSRIYALLATIETLSPEAAGVLFADAYDFRSFNNYASIKQKLIDTAYHAAWSDFFAEYHLYSVLDNRTFNRVTAPYMFADSYKRNYYSDVKQLTPFTYDAALLFFGAHIVDTKARRKQAIDDMLNHCGASWKVSPSKFTAKMTFRGYDAYNDASRVLLNFYRVASWLYGIDFDVNAFNLSLRNTRIIDGAQVSFVDGLPITVEVHANGNATIRITDKALVNLLNGIALYNSEGV